MTKDRFAKLMRREQAAQKQTANMLTALRQMAQATDVKVAAIAVEHGISVEDARSFIEDMESTNGN